MTLHDPPHLSAPATPDRASTRHRLGLPIVAVIGLALLAAPRVILHDLDILHEGTAINAMFVFLPPVVWIIVALAARVPNPFLTILAIGVCYGLFLALGHQLLWGIAFADDLPQLGGNLGGLDPSLQSVIFRSIAFVSSIVTGAVVGAIAGLVAWVLNALLPRTGQAR
jgi:hypothetical protein